MNKAKIVGVVTRKPYVSDRFAAFSVRPAQDASAQRAAPILDVVVFDADPIRCAGMLSEGDSVSVVGHLGSKKLQDKDRNAAQIDGRDVWIMQLIADVIDVPEAKPAAKAPPRRDAPAPGDNDIPF